MESARLPVWKWGLDKFGIFGFLMGTAPALLPVPFVAATRFFSGHSMIPDVCYIFLFAVIAAYGSYLLEIRREVSYIRVQQSDISPTLRPLWIKT